MIFIFCMGQSTYSSYSTYRSSILESDWHIDDVNANRLASASQLAGVILVPLYGWCLDRFGNDYYRVAGTWLSLVLVGISFLYFGLAYMWVPTNSSNISKVDQYLLPNIWIFMLSLGFNMFFACVWPAIISTVPRDLRDQAMGNLYH